MALTRARPVFGSAGAKADLERIIDATLRTGWDRQRLLADAVDMRREMARHKPPMGPFDIKLGEGGLVDLEFAVHVLQLTHAAALDPRLDIAVVELVEEGHAPREMIEAHRLLTRMLVTMRLVSPASAEPPPASRPLVARACGLDDWDELLAAHGDARHRVSTFWRKVAGQAAE
jgi:glutamate-ammonia-ligase adenylyltransferase